jgi:hypothetical protein
MSDVSQGAGWWQASDNKWYPPPAGSPYGTAAPSPYGTAAASPYGAGAPSPYGAAPPGSLPPQSYHPGYQMPYQPYATPARATNAMAIASLVLGILWLYWIGSILALVFGYIALRQIRERHEGGRGMAIAGIVLGWVGIGIATLTIIAAVVSRGH